MPEPITRGKPVFERYQMLALRTLRTRVDGGLWSEYPHRPQETYQRPGYHSEPALVWTQGQAEPVLEWL